MTVYQTIRLAGKSMHGKVLEATKHLDFHPRRMAKRMTLPTSGRTLIFDSEVAQNAFIDFWFHEYKVNGKSLVESVDPVAAGLEPLEAEALEAHCNSRTSFFEAKPWAPEKHLIRMRDLLDPAGAVVLLTDMGFSDSMQRMRIWMVMFCRMLTIRGLTLTSGFSFTFLPERAPGILQAYRQKMKKIPPADLAEARFVFFFHKYRQLGMEQEFQDVA